MRRSKLLQQVIAVTLVMLILVGCVPLTDTPMSEAPALTTTPTSIPPTVTPTPALPTATLESESLNLQIGDTFTVDPYQVKLIQAEERPSIIALSGGEIKAVAPKQDDSRWLVLTIEITNSGNEAAPLKLLPSSSFVLEANGQQAELSAIGVLAPEGNAMLLGFMREQILSKGFLAAGASGRIFALPDHEQKLLLTNGTRHIIVEPSGPQWDLGSVGAKGSTNFSLLFEVPAGADELTWQYLGSAPVGLPKPQTTSLSNERGPNLTVLMSDSELCQVAEALDRGLECKS